MVADALSRKSEVNTIMEVSIKEDIYERIKEEYKENTYLKRILKALEDPKSEEAKRLGKQVGRFELKESELLFFKEGAEEPRL
ncbi:5691_t:CDS:1, partial [Scutellospora calospora]